MKTLILKPTELLRAADIIKNGGLVAFPTETVYGLGANALSGEAVAKIFVAKGRPSDNPLIVHLADKAELENVARDVPQVAYELIERFAPGPLTLVLKKRPEIPNEVTAGLDTVAVRIPADPIARELIALSGVPVAAPSSNLSGKPSPTTAQHVIDDMTGRIDAIIEGGASRVGVESTVLDITGKIPVILRPGGVTLSQIREICPDCELDRHITERVEPQDTPKCPGMKYKHYSPEAEVYVVEGEDCSDKLSELIKVAKNEGKKVGAITLFGHKTEADFAYDCGSSNEEYAAELFDALREMDKQGMDVVYAEYSIFDDYGLAVKNRLYKAAANRIITL